MTAPLLAAASLAALARLDLAFDPATKEPLVILALATVGYTAFHYGVRHEVALGRLAEGASPGERAATYVRAKALGAFALAAPALVAQLTLGLTPSDLGLTLPAPGRTALAALGGLAALLPLIVWNSRNPSQWVAYPELRLDAYPRGVVVRSAIGWTVYLIGYELFFRGLLLLGMVRWVGTWPGIAITTALYVFAHLPKTNATETWGTLPAGVLFGLATLYTGSIWAGVVVHVAMANVTEILCARANPAVHFGPVSK